MALSDILKLAGAAFTPNDMAHPTFGYINTTEFTLKNCVMS